MKIDMLPTEVSIAHTLAVMRNCAARGNGVKDKQMGKQDPIQIERDGLLAEMAFGKAFNLWPDLSIFPRKGGADLIGRNGKRIDVKASRYKTARLAIHKDKQLGDVDVYVLAIVDDSSVDIVGYIEAEEALRAENLGDLGHGVGYVIPQDRLKPL
jgi:hypothetical protein